MQFEDEEALDEARREMNAEEAGGAESREFLFACEMSQLAADGSRGKEVFREHDEIALFRFGERVHAISNICPHELSPLLASGSVDREACTVSCPLHGWTFDIATGRQVGGSSGVAVYDVRVEGEEIWVSGVGKSM